MCPWVFLWCFNGRADELKLSFDFQYSINKVKKKKKALKVWFSVLAMASCTSSVSIKRCHSRWYFTSSSSCSRFNKIRTNQRIYIVLTCWPGQHSLPSAKVPGCLFHLTHIFLLSTYSSSASVNHHMIWIPEKCNPSGTKCKYPLRGGNKVQNFSEKHFERQLC